jgi:hypothetical protein
MIEIRSIDWGGVDEDGSEVAVISTLAAKKFGLLVRGGKSLNEAEEETESWLAEQGVPFHFVGIALAEVIAMMPWRWTDGHLDGQPPLPVHQQYVAGSRVKKQR